MDPTNLFAGYIVPHPLQHRVQIKIHTKADDVHNPGTAMKDALMGLLGETRKIKDGFTQALNDFDSAGGNEEGKEGDDYELE